GQARRELAHHLQLFETAAELRPRADSVFEQQHELSELESLCRFGDALEEVEHALLDREAFVVARMRDEVFGAYGDSSFELAPEGCDGVGAGLAVRGREVDEVIVVNGERGQVEFFAGSLEEFDRGLAGSRAFPLAGAGGEDLERIGA